MAGRCACTVGLLASLQCDSSLLRGPESKGPPGCPQGPQSLCQPPSTLQPAQLRRGPGAYLSFLRESFSLEPPSPEAATGWRAGGGRASPISTLQARRQTERCCGRRHGQCRRAVQGECPADGQGPRRASALALCLCFPELHGHDGSSCYLQWGSGLFRAEGNASPESHPSPGIHKSS